MKKLSLFSAVLILSAALFARLRAGRRRHLFGRARKFRGLRHPRRGRPRDRRRGRIFSAPLFRFFSEGDTAYTLVQRLKEQGKICYEGSESAYGFMVYRLRMVENGEENMALRADGASHAFIAPLYERGGGFRRHAP